MDKFDAQLQNAREEYIPSDGFVERTMEEVKKRKIRRRFSVRLWAPAAVGLVAVLIIAVIIVPKPTSETANSAKSEQNAQKTAQVKPSSSPAAINDGTDNATIERDLDSVMSSMGQSAADQSVTDSAINDNQQSISISTN